MNGGSNLPPGCSSPDGGIDHAQEAAFESLVEALPVMPDDELEKIADDLQHAHYVEAFAKVMEAETPEEAAKAFFDAMTAEYQSGHTDAVMETKQIIEAEEPAAELGPLKIEIIGNVLSIEHHGVPVVEVVGDMAAWGKRS